MFKSSNKSHQLTIVEAAGIKHNGLYSVNCVRLDCSSENITVLDSSQVFDERILFSVMHRSQKLILNQIFDIYPRIKFINKGLSIIQKRKVRCDALKVIWFGINSKNFPLMSSQDAENIFL